MEKINITGQRTINQRLLEKECKTPESVVDWLGAVQAQDFSAAKWSLGKRLESPSDEKIESAFNEGKFLRTHVMRPTWHFIMPEDLVWMQKLTSDPVKKLMNYYNNKLELTLDLFKKTEKIITKNLSGRNYLTRQEIKKILSSYKIETNVQRLAHIMMWAELDAIVTSGPLKGKQFTYALVEERVKKVKKLNHQKSLAILATKYFQSHGPAQLKDFSWWSGLSIKDCQEAISLTKPKLASENINGKEYWFLSYRNPPHTTHYALLLSIFDEYVIAYKDRSDINREEKDIENMISMGSALTAVMVFNGKVIGTWKRKLSKNSVEIKLSPFMKLSKEEKGFFKKEADSYGKFLGKKVLIS